VLGLTYVRFVLELLRDGFGKHPLFHCVVAEKIEKDHDKGGVNYLTFLYKISRLNTI